ncbi:hypothetical protein [Radicibacter daui]|uniref:hypothetical protein n=1 Tax=Radicibacter daui TaxID=3064829 RepID=UPI004046FA5F
MIDHDYLFTSYKQPTEVKVGRFRLTLANGKYDASVTFNDEAPFVAKGFEPMPLKQLCVRALAWMHLAHGLIYRGPAPVTPDEPTIH